MAPEAGSLKGAAVRAPHVPAETPMTPAEFQALATAPDAAMADLERFRQLLVEGNDVMNLVGPATLPDFWSRHAWDSAQLFRMVPEARTWADLGAGAGFPGLVLAILLKSDTNAPESVHVHLVESMAKRCRFLSQVVSELALPATVHNARAEDLKLTVEVVTARACAPMGRLFGYAKPYLKAGALGLFLKGQDAASELQDAKKYWKFDADLSPSLSDNRGRIVSVKGPVVERRV